MKLEHEEKRTPTFRTWAKSPAYKQDETYPVVRVFANDEWNTLTFVTDEFRVNFKYPSGKDYKKVYEQVSKILTKHCRVAIRTVSDSRADIQLDAASDADESPQLFEKDDLGFSPKART